MVNKKSQKKMSQGTDQGAPSRRRSGLFKKAGELTTLCALETALVILCPDGDAASFSHAGAEPVFTNSPPTRTPLSQAAHEANLQALEKQYHDLLEKLEAEKQRGEKLQQMMKMNEERHGRRLWAVPIDELNQEELLKLYAMMEDFQERAQKALMKRLAQTNAPTEGSSIDPNGHGTGPEN